MVPPQLKTADFESYPPQARRLVTENLDVLQQLPFVYRAVLLRELISYDWKLPAERQRLAGQLTYVGQLSSEKLAALMRGFAALNMNPSFEKAGWTANPSATLEQITAWLWSSHQMDTFRAVAERFSSDISAAVPSRLPSQPRLGIVVIGQGVTNPGFPLFRKLRPYGVYLNGVKAQGNFDTLLAAAQSRVQNSTNPPARSEDFLHWYIDGGSAYPSSSLTQVSYTALNSARQQLLQRTQRAIESGGMGPERLRSLLAELRPEDIGLTSSSDAEQRTAVLNYFQLSLLTEGSGTQIFSTTFVQWGARECLRRAEPETLLLRFAPRQEQQPMNTMLSGQKGSAPDPQGSIVDADMGAYYTWINMRRLSGAEQLRFLVYFEGHNEALIIGPGLPGGTTSDSAMDMQGVLKLLS